MTVTPTFTRADGSTGTVGVVLLNADHMNTRHDGPPIAATAEAAAVPNLKGLAVVGAAPVDGAMLVARKHHPSLARVVRGVARSRLVSLPVMPAMSRMRLSTASKSVSEAVPSSTTRSQRPLVV